MVLLLPTESTTASIHTKEQLHKNISTKLGVSVYSIMKWKCLREFPRLSVWM